MLWLVCHTMRLRDNSQLCLWQGKTFFCCVVCLIECNLCRNKKRHFLTSHQKHPMLINYVVCACSQTLRTGLYKKNPKRSCKRKCPPSKVQNIIMNNLMLDWIEIWGIWRPSQHLKVIVVLLKTIPEAFLLCGMAHYPTEWGHSHQGGLQQCLGRWYVSK